MVLQDVKTALITGASSGIGLEIANVFAKKGFNLILISRSEDKLNNISSFLEKEYGVNIKIITKDLIQDNSAEEIYKEIKSSRINIDVLINNAGVGYSGLFHNIDIEKDIEVIKINIETLTRLTKLFSKDMIDRGGGKILNIASTGAYQPGPYISVYYAAKSYILSFSLAIRNELKDYGVDVCVLCPGATRTQFSKNAGKADIKKSMLPEEVAKAAFKGLERNKAVIIPGLFNKIAIVFSKLAPGYISAKIVRKIQESMVKNFRKSK
ncbi:short-subunit dehydrogenase [Clostridium algifaecis]|uniref:Short-subunit dehydrogenase n=1 Tax=Clostridium algifaecis TaxID=1472040 RepID=A0ABS4KP39_9CLOT|nr:SDR family oxidoreductase [Clostridium algifaecis]MBP2031804.1 short-subunit dehydrogenase [Clostridium algifaecis]